MRIKFYLLCSLFFYQAAAIADNPPQRIVSLTPHITEMLFAIGAGNQVVATDQASDYPDAVKQLPRVANYQSLNQESLLAVKPDLVVIWSSTQELMKQQIAALHIPMLVLNSQHLDDLPKELRLLGEKTGHSSQAEQVAQHIETTYQTWRDKNKDLTPIPTFYQLWYPPLTTAGKGSFITEIMTLCGAKNIFAESQLAYPQLSQEAVIVANPEVILATHHGADLKHWNQWPQINAVKHQHLFMLNKDWMHRLSPRIELGIQQMCEVMAQVRDEKKSS